MEKIYHNVLSKYKKVSEKQILKEITVKDLATLKKLSSKFNIGLKEAFYLAGNNLKSPAKCKTCKGKVNFINFNNGYQPYCCSTCCNRNPEKKKEIERLMLLRFGVKNASQAECIKEKKINTCRKNHGVDYPQQSEKVRVKSVKSLKKKYGVDNPSKMVDYRQKYEKTCKERYGCENPMYNMEVAIKAKKNSYAQKTFKYKGFTFDCQGYEDVVIKWLIDKGVDPKTIDSYSRKLQVPYVFDSSLKVYYPDILCVYKEKVRVIEVKSFFTLGVQDGIKNNKELWKQNKRKFKFATAFYKGKGIEFFLIIATPKKVVKVIKNPNELSYKELRKLLCTICS